MAGYSRIYCIGGLGGFGGADGINPILLQIWVGDASRQWFEAHYSTMTSGQSARSKDCAGRTGPSERAARRLSRILS